MDASYTDATTGTGTRRRVLPVSIRFANHGLVRHRHSPRGERMLGDPYTEPRLECDSEIAHRTSRRSSAPTDSLRCSPELAAITSASGKYSVRQAITQLHHPGSVWMNPMRLDPPVRARVSLALYSSNSSIVRGGRSGSSPAARNNALL